MTDIKVPKNIEEVLLLLQQERPILTKTKSGQVGNQRTKYADMVEVNEVVLKPLNNWDTIWVCEPDLVDGVFGLHYSLVHVPSMTKRAGVWPLKLSDNQQQMGSAVTYGRRYALLAVTGIVAEDEDDDGAAASGQRTVQRQPPERRTPTKPASPATVQRAAKPPLPNEPNGPSKAQLGEIHRLWRLLGWTPDVCLEWTLEQTGRKSLATTKDLSAAELDDLISKAKTLAFEAERGPNNDVDEGTDTPPNPVTETQPKD